MGMDCSTTIIQCSTPSYDDQPLYLNIFRGEPAISRFDRHITPNHKSSHRFVTLTGSVLLATLDATASRFDSHTTTTRKSSHRCVTLRGSVPLSTFDDTQPAHG